MVYSSFIIQKAQEFGIDLNQPVGILWVCKLLLENTRDLLGSDLRKVIKVLDDLEFDLREVSNAFNYIQYDQYGQLAIFFIDNGYLTSVECILQWVDEAHSHVNAASMVREYGGNEAQVHFEASQSLKMCRRSLATALKEFHLD